MKVFWLLLFGISILPFSANAVDCYKGNKKKVLGLPSYYCTIKMTEKDNNCVVTYNEGEDGYDGEKGMDNKSTWGERGCEIGKDGSVLCYCNDKDFCNDDILKFQVELQEAYSTKQDPNLKEVSNCLRQATKQECAVGKPGEMVFAERLSGQNCFIRMVKDQGTYNVVEVGQNDGLGYAYCDRFGYNNEIQCYCNTYRCNIQKDTFSQDTRVMIMMNDDEDGTLDDRAAPIVLFTSHIKTCGESFVLYDPNGTQSCVVVFKMNQNGAYAKFAFISNDLKRTGCFASNQEENEVTCVFEENNSEGQKFVAEITMRINGVAWLEVIPPTTSTPSTSTTTTTVSTTSLATTTSTTTTTTTPMTTTSTPMTTTTSPEQLTCWASDITEVTKDKSNSVCFIDYAMVSSRCELRGRGIDEKDNATTGCRIVESTNMGNILRCTCAENGCNKKLDGQWAKLESNITEHMELIDCMDRLVRGETLPTSGTSSIAPSPSSLSQTEDSKSSVYIGLFIGAAAFNVLTVLTILALIIALIKMKKGGEAKQATVKVEKASKGSTAITIEKPVEKDSSTVPPPKSATKPLVKKDSSTVPPPASNTNQEANQREEAADKTTTGTGPSDLDYTGGTTDSDSTGPEGFSEARVTVRGFNRN